MRSSHDTAVTLVGLYLLSSRSAAEIDELYENKVPAWRWSKTTTAVEEEMHAAVIIRAQRGPGDGA